MSTYNVTDTGTGTGPGTYRWAVTNANANTPTGETATINLIVDVTVQTNSSTRTAINYTANINVVGGGNRSFTFNPGYYHVIGSGNTVTFDGVTFIGSNISSNGEIMFQVANDNSVLTFVGSNPDGTSFDNIRYVNVFTGGTMNMIRQNIKNSSHNPFITVADGTVIMSDCNVDSTVTTSTGNSNPFISGSFGSSISIEDSEFMRTGSRVTPTPGGCLSLTNSFLNISNSTFTGYRSQANGGAIYFGNTSTTPQTCVIANATFSNCHCTTSDQFGSAIYANSSNGNTIMTIVDSFINNNGLSTAGTIGVLSTFQVDLNVSNTDIIGNRSSAGQVNVRGGTSSFTFCNINEGNGGIYISEGANVLLENSLIARNTNENSSFGLSIAGEDTIVSIYNSTIGDNNRPGIRSTEGTLVMRGVTVANNGSEGLESGGINNAGAIVDIGNTIVADNFNGDVTGTFESSGYNLVGIATDPITLNGFTAAGDIVGTFSDPVDALLAPLGDNGGPTQSYGLFVDSPAIQAGNLGLSQGDYDQRGSPFPRDIDGSVDIGAIENVILICFRGDSIVRARNIITGEITDILAKNLYQEEYEVFDTNENKFVPVIHIFTTGVTGKYIVIKKNLLGDNMPSQDLYITEGHPIMIDGVEVYSQNIVGGRKVETEPDFIYSVCTDKRRPIMINNLPVMTWETEEWYRTADEHNIKWRDNMRKV